MAKLKFSHNDEEIELPDGSPLAEICEEAGVPFACTEGVCGTCVIEIKEGEENLSPQTVEEEDFLGEGNTQERLACQCKIKGGCVKISF
ncbi:MAG: (2Fe-2S)-binding protein [Chlamydiia bacterium]|nr:(2Fe-2S)-binding protein [Chlamydiia bacterium]